MSGRSVRAAARGGGFALAALLAAPGCGCPPTHDGGHDAGPEADVDVVGTCPARGQDETVGGMDLVVGTGRDGTLGDFRPFSPGDPVWITPGEQGLQHVVVAFRGRDFSPVGPLVTVRLVRAADCELVGFLRYRVGFRADPEEPSRLAVEAVRVTLLDDRDRYEYCTVLGRDAVVVVDLDDGAGRRAHREVRVHVAGIDPGVRSDVREAWLAACQRDDGGAPDAADASADAREADAPPAGDAGAD